MRNKLLILISLIGLTVFVSPVGAQTALEQPLTLDSCLKAAKENNSAIRSAQLDVLVSQEVKKQMLWKFFPQVSIEGFAFQAVQPLVDADVTSMGLQGGTSDFLKNVFDLLNRIDSTANLSSEVKWLRWGAAVQARAAQPVYWGGQIVTANKLAKLGIEASSLKQEMTERDVLQEVTETYWLAAGLAEKRATVTKVTELLDSIADVAQAAYNHGLVTRNDLLRVQLKQNEMQTKAMQLENGIQLVERLLCHLIGQTYDAELTLQTIPEKASSPFSLNGSSNRPEFKLLDVNVRYNQLMRRLTLGESLPHLAIGISGGYSNFFEKNTFNGLAFATLSIPITGWGETAHKLRQHDLQIRQAELMKEDLQGKLLLQNRQVYDQLIEADKLVEQHQTGRDLAEENYRVALLNYTSGVATMTELLEAEALLLQAENAYTDARITYLCAERKFNDYNK